MKYTQPKRMENADEGGRANEAAGTLAAKTRDKKGKHEHKRQVGMETEMTEKRATEKPIKGSA